MAAGFQVAWRVLRAVEVVALAVLVSQNFPRLPCAVAAAASVLRVAASAILHPRSVFVIANAIVVVVVALSRRDAASSAPPSPSRPDRDAQSQDPFLPFPAAPLLLPPIDEAPATPAAAKEEEEEETVFVDKEAVHVTVRAQPPRRSRSEKTRNGGGARPRAGSPELRRAESENSLRRRLASAAAPEEWGAENAEEFRRAVEAFIAKQQTRFHREESLVAVAGECAPPVAGAAGTVALVE